MATVTASYNWVSGETVTPTKLNTTAAPTVVVADNEVTTAKILDANVTNAKLATGIDASKLTTGTLPIARIADANVTPAKLSQPLTLATAQATTSGTSIDFTGIPSWAKRITVMLSGVSTSNGFSIGIQIGTVSGIENSGYNSSSGVIVSTPATGSVAQSSAFLLTGTGTDAAATYGGSAILTFAGSNVWVLQSVIGGQTLARTFFSAGSKFLAGTLDRVRLTTLGGTGTFDAGSVNIMYEG